MNRNIIWKLIILYGAIAVIIGAFGAHGLKPHLSEDQYNSFLTGSRYHFFHTIIAAIVMIIPSKFRTWISSWTPVLFLIGILFFSGSIYILACRDMIGMNVSWLGPITPIGGLILIAGWLSMLSIKTPA